MEATVGTMNIHGAAGPDREIQDILGELRSAYEAAEDREIQHFLRKLRTSDYESAKARNPTRVPGTWEWFLAHQQFNSWRYHSQATMLWVSGDPGSGKSVLARTLVDEIFPSPDFQNTTICYFFFKDGSHEQGSIANALSAILHQLFCNKIALIKHALEVFKIYGNRLVESFPVMWKILERAAADPEAGYIICVLDALDECEEGGRMQLIGALTDFYSNDTSSGLGLKFLITSRPYNDIERGLRPKELERIYTIRLSGEQEADTFQQDIDLFIDARVHEVASNLDLGPEAQDFLRERLHNVPNRTYLWIHLVFDAIMGSVGATTPKRLARIIEELPNTTSEAYESILGRSSNPRFAMILLRIIVVSNRPLSLQELNVAVSLGDGIKSYEDLDLEDDEHFQRAIRTACGLFVNIFDSKIYLIHQTAKEFLISRGVSDEGFARPGRWAYSINWREANLFLASRCILYLFFDCFRVDPLDLEGEDTTLSTREVIRQYTKQNIFLDYAASHWTHHLREAGEDVSEQILLDRAIGLCSPQSWQFTTWFPVYWISFHNNANLPRGLTDLMVASHAGLWSFVRLMLEEGADILARDSDGRTALHRSTETGHVYVVSVLIDKDAEVNMKDNGGVTPLHLSAENGNEKVVDLLLRRGADLMAIDNSGATPLHQAAKYGRGALVSLLLRQGADISLRDSDGATPLYRAVEKGHDTVADLLLKNGADISVVDNSGATLLHQAAKAGNGVLVSLLLRQGLDISAKDSSGATSLHRAAEKGHETVVSLLLDKKADAAAKDKGGDTALHLAAEQGHPGVVQLLLECGIEFKSKGSKGRLPQQLALDGKENSESAYTKERFNAVLRLLKDAAFAAATETPPLANNSVDEVFTANIIYFLKESPWKLPYPCAVSELLSGQGIPIPGVSKDSLTFKWIHLPANNMRWVERLMDQHYQSRGDNLAADSILKKELWSERQHRGSKRSRIAFMRSVYQHIDVPLGDDGEDNEEGDIVFMPFIHWEMCSKQLDMEFFLLLKLLLKPFHDHKMKLPSGNFSWNKLSSDDITFLWDQLLESHLEAAKRYQKNSNKPSTSDVERRRILLPEGGKSISNIKDIKNPWGLSLEDLGIFKTLPPEKQSPVISNSKKKASKNPQQVYTALQRCYQWGLDEYPEKRLADAYVEDIHPLHLRRTLDQSYYYMLDNTRSRDQDQVVSRYIRNKMKRDQTAIIMVDQLWIWILNDTIITSFPQRRWTDDDDLDKIGMTDVFSSIQEKASGITNVHDLAAFIMKKCSGACFDTTTRHLEDHFQFLELFENSIGDVANSEADCYKWFVKSLEKSNDEDLSNIKKESRLLREIKDILDELKMILMIFEEQAQIQKSIRGQQGARWGNTQTRRLVLEPISQYIGKVRKMQAQAKTTYESLKDLMDLRQKHANLSEARSARKQAVATSKQGNTIMVFTIVTILFLPASFMASFFALAISQFPRDASSMLDLRYVVKYMLIFTAVVSTFFILMAFQINQIVDIFRDIVGTFRPKKETPATDKGIEERVEIYSKGHVLISVEPVVNPWVRHPLNIFRGRHKEQKSPEP